MRSARANFGTPPRSSLFGANGEAGSTTCRLRSSTFAAGDSRALPHFSPYAREGTSGSGYVSHTQYEYGSILKFIEQVYNLPPIGSQEQGYTDSRANSIIDSFDFRRSPGLSRRSARNIPRHTLLTSHRRMRPSTTSRPWQPYTVREIALYALDDIPRVCRAVRPLSSGGRRALPRWLIWTTLGIVCALIPFSRPQALRYHILRRRLRLQPQWLWDCISCEPLARTAKILHSFLEVQNVECFARGFR